MNIVEQYDTNHINTEEKEIVIAFVGVSYEDYDKICSTFKNRVGYILLRSDSLERIEELGYKPETIVVSKDMNFESLPKNISFIPVSNEIGSQGNNFVSISSERLEQSTKDFETYIEKAVDIMAHDALRVRMNRLIEQRQSQITDLLNNVESYEDIEKIKDSLLNMFNSKDSTTHNHTLAVYELTDVMIVGMEQIGTPLSQNDANTLKAVALLHDLGKLVTPDQLIKNDDRLTAGEFAIMKQHASENFKFAEYGYLQEIYNKTLMHHYRYDGKGYHNQGEIGSDIDIHSRMMTVIDSFEAMNSSDRPYTKQNLQSIEKSFETLFNNAQEASDTNKFGGQFDPVSSRAFLIGFEYKLKNDAEFRNKWLNYEMQKELKQNNNGDIITSEEKLTSMFDSLSNNIANFDRRGTIKY